MFWSLWRSGAVRSNRPPGAHGAQTPATQLGVPPEHTTPHSPQDAALVRSASQPLFASPSQSSKPVLQVNTQAPAVHAAALAFVSTHALPHAPQLVVVLSGVSHPSGPRMLTQSPKPVLQLKPQTPEAQVRVAFARAGQGAQLPQWSTFELKLASQPLRAMPSQLPKFAEHPTGTHPPLAQPLVVVLARLHVVPQAPQLAGSMLVLAQKVAGAVPQVVSPPPQVVPQTLAEQTCPLAQALVHEPQRVLSTRVSTSQPLAGALSQLA